MAEQEDLDNLSHLHDADDIRDPDELEKEFSIEDLRETISWGTRKLNLIVNHESIVFHIVNLSEKKKYGVKISEKIAENRESCMNASLSLRDNQVFLGTMNFKGEGKRTKKEVEEGMNQKIITKIIHGGIKRGTISIDDEGNYVSKKDIERFNDEGEKQEKTPSSLFLKNSPGEIILERVISINEVLDHDVSSRYILFPIEERSENNLRDMIFELEDSNNPRFLAFKFNYFPSYEPKDAFLQLIEENDNEYMLMNVGNYIEPIFYGMQSSIGDVIEIEDDFDFDLSI